MRKMKRSISWILCLAMLFVAMPIPSLAEGEEAPVPEKVQAPEEERGQAESQGTDQAQPQGIVQAEPQGAESQATDQAGTTAADQTETTATNQAAPKETNEVETTAADPVDANGQAGEGDEAEPNANATSGDKSNKTATPLDDQNETEITLTFPGKQDILGSDIVFVLDKSGASAQEEIFTLAKQFLDEIKTNAEEKGIPVNVGVVYFTNIGIVRQPLTEIVEGYDSIQNALKADLGFGTNMHAGLLAAKKMLQDDQAVLDKNKHVILISDGATYLYCKDGVYTKAYTLSLIHI